MSLNYYELMETPTASINITTNGTHDVTNYATAVVNAAKPEQAKTATPTTSQQTITPDDGYALSSVTVNAMPTGSMGTVSASKSISGNTATVTPSISAGTAGYNEHAAVSGTAVTVVASELISDTTATASDVLSGKAFYLANGTKTNGTIGTGALSTPTVNSSGLVTASVGTTGYMTSGTSSTLQLSTQSAKTVTPSTSSQTAVASGKYTTGAVTVAAIPSGALSTPTVNSTGLVTASVGTSGYLASGTSSTLQLPYVDNYSVGAMVANYSAPSALMNVYTGTIWGGSVQIYEMSGDEFASSISVKSLGGMDRQCFVTPFRNTQVIGFYFNGYMGGSTYGTTFGSFLCMPTTSVYTTQYTMYLLGSHTSSSSVTFNKAGSGQLWTAAKGWYCSSSTSNFYFNTDYASYSSLYILYCTEPGTL